METAKQDLTLNPAKWPVVNKVEVPIKKVLSIYELRQFLSHAEETTSNKNGENSSGTATEANLDDYNTEDFRTLKFEHSTESFCAFCACSKCIEYREVILLLMDDHLKTKSVCKVMHKMIKMFYSEILEDAPPKVAEIYESLLEEEKCSWMVNGVVNKAKLQFITFDQILSLANNLILLLFSTLLIVDDPQQFFEIMSYHIECFTKAYAEGISHIIASSKDLPANDLINYVLRGYDGISSAAKRMSNFLFVFENNHLDKFGINWLILNKRMYQRWVHTEFAETAPDCLIKLKDELPSETYHSIVRRYIKFDDDMMMVERSWRDVWVAINNFNASDAEVKRRERIRTINGIFERLRGEQLVPFTQFIDIPEWPEQENRQLVWQNMVAYIRQKWPSVDEVRLNAALSSDKCRKCSALLEYHCNACKCVTCLIAGGPSLPKTTSNEIEKGVCLKCILEEKTANIKSGNNYVSQIMSKCSEFMIKYDEKAIKDIIWDDIQSLFGINDSGVDCSGLYHLSWAVFKHLKDRLPYPFATIDEKYFCKNCTRQACTLAKKILNNEVAFGLARQLMKHYQPVVMNREEMMELMPYLVLYTNSSTLNQHSIVYDPPNDDLVTKSFWAFINSASVHYFLDNAGDDTNDAQIQHLKLVNGDIELPIEYLETKPKTQRKVRFLSPEPAVKEKITPEPEEPTTAPPPAKKPVEVPRSKSREKDTAKPKHGFQCCADHSDMVEHCMDNHFNKMCFHDKAQECNRARVIETRDRLRKKLNQLSNSKKNVKVINKNVTKCPLELIKCLNKSPPSLSSLSKDMAKLQNKANITKETISIAVTNEDVSGSPKISSNVADINKSSVQLPIIKPSTSKSIPDCYKEIFDSDSELTEDGEEILCDGKAIEDWVKDTLTYIEGSTELKKSKNAANNKKAAKKAKQKQKKEEQRRIEELQEFRDQFHEIYWKEFISKNELKAQKAAKKKDKKKIGELENNIKKLAKAKSGIEKEILQLIGLVKNSNSEFKFSYLPTKEQQQEIMQKALHEEPQQHHQQNHQQKFNSCQQNECSATQEFEDSRNSQTVHQILQQQAVKMNLVRQTAEADPKRMVTIRRVVAPRVEGAEVTVTAKGASPDKDKLLYTFINGQLVPAASLDSHTLSVLQPNLFPKLTEMQVKYIQEQQRLQNQNAQNIVQMVHHETAQTSDTADPASEICKTKTQLKKERKRAKKCAEEQEHFGILKLSDDLEQLPRAGILSVDNTKKSSKINSGKELVENAKQSHKVKDAPKNVKNQTGQESVEKLSKTNSKKDHKVLSRENSTESSTKSLSQNSTQSNKKVELQNTDRKQNKLSKKGQKSSASSLEEKKPSPKQIDPKLEKRKSKVIDSGQFDNNQFKMLHLDEFSSGAEESEPEIESVASSMVKPPVAIEPSKISKIQQKSNLINLSNKQDSNSTSATPKNLLKSNIKSNKLQHGMQDSKPGDLQNVVGCSRPKGQTPSPAPSLQNSVGSAKQKKSSNKIAKNSKNESEQLRQQEQQKRLSIDKTVMNAENMAKSLHHTMQRLNLNSDTTIEVAQDYPETPSNMMHLNVSIMEQLNRGVQVEDLALPPGITLTKVDPSRAEALRAKRESIGKLSQSIKPPTPPQHQTIIAPPPIISPGMLPHYGNFGQNPPGIIMVDAAPMKDIVTSHHKMPKSEPLSAMEKKSKKNKRKNKKKKLEDNASTGVQRPGQNINNQSSDSPKMITLRNPMFHGQSSVQQGGVTGGATGGGYVQTIPGRVPMAPLPMDQPAAIIKNENGMFTIRNPALHQAFTQQQQQMQMNGSGMPPGAFRQCNSTYHPQPQPHQPQTLSENTDNSSLSFFSDPSTSAFASYSNNVGSGSVDNGVNKHISAIGSEVKSAQKQKKLASVGAVGGGNCISGAGGAGSWQGGTASNCPPSPSNGGWLNCTPIQQQYHQSNYYNGNLGNRYDAFSQSSSDCGSLFNSHNHHSCGDDSPPPTVTGYNRYLDGIPNSGQSQQPMYDDVNYLRKLMPGQRLNSEVTIHDINDSKFNRNNQSPISHGVEITPISGLSNGFVYRNGSITDNQQHFQQRRSPNKNYSDEMTDYGDNLFAPNQMLNLNDLESDERDIESFKRFSYGFEPPKNKPKVNINVNDLLTMNSKKSHQQSASTTTSSSTNPTPNPRASPYMDESLESFVRNMNSLKIAAESNNSVNLIGINSSTTTAGSNNWW